MVHRYGWEKVGVGHSRLKYLVSFYFHTILTSCSVSLDEERDDSLVMGPPMAGT